VQGPPHALQEAVAEQLCQRLLCHDARIDAVRVYLRKPHVALPGVLDSVGEFRVGGVGVLEALLLLNA
jgi:dihydroneopterin aldolase